MNPKLKYLHMLLFFNTFTLNLGEESYESSNYYYLKKFDVHNYDTPFSAGIGKKNKNFRKYSNDTLSPLRQREKKLRARDTIPFRWIDYSEKDHDFFFDRVVGILHGDKHICVGVFINRNHVLTSYNPFRKLMREGVDRSDITVVVLTQRMYETKEPTKKFENLNGNAPTERRFVNYKVLYMAIDCARPVTPVPEGIPLTWHGPEKSRENSPTHDLFVIRTKRRASFLPDNEDPIAFSKYKNQEYEVVGPRRTIVAQSSDIIVGDVEYASFGSLSKLHGTKNRVLTKEHPYIKEYSNCAKWLPKEWGHFICVESTDLKDIPFLGAGSPLFYKKKLFGVGVFMLRRMNESFSVFTNIRKYRTHIFRTCIWPE